MLALSVDERVDVAATPDPDVFTADVVHAGGHTSFSMRLCGDTVDVSAPDTPEAAEIVLEAFLTASGHAVSWDRFHLVGQHDQATHGRRGGRVGPAHLNDDPDRFGDWSDLDLTDQSAVKAAAEDFAARLTAERDDNIEYRVRWAIVNSDATTISIDAYTPGAQVAAMTRLIEHDRGLMRAASLDVDDPFQGQGIGTHMREGFEDFAASMGVESVMVGATNAWARAGYDWSGWSDMKQLGDAVRGYAPELAAQFDQAVAMTERGGTIPDIAPTPWEVASVLGRETMMKAIPQWAGVKPLRRRDDTAEMAVERETRERRLAAVRSAYDEWWPQYPAAADGVEDSEAEAEFERILNGETKHDMAVATFHLQGQHDQDTHGRRGEVSLRSFARVYDGDTFEVGGEQFTTHVGVVVTLESGYHRVEGLIRDANKEIVGEFGRSLSPDGTELHNSYFEIETSRQGEGIGSAFLQRTEARLVRDFGVREISLRAEDVGRYAWAARGYTTDDSATVEEWIDTTNQMIREGGLSPDTAEWREMRSVFDGWEAALDRNGAVHPGDLLRVSTEFRRMFLNGPAWDATRQVEPLTYRKVELAAAAFHLQGQHDQSTHGNRGGTGTVDSPADARQALLDGRPATVAVTDAVRVLQEIGAANGGVVDLTNLSLDGYPGLFEGVPGDGLRSRAEMPQVPQNQIDNFQAVLQVAGVHFRPETVDASSLKASQTELDATKVGQMLTKVETGMYTEGHPPWVSSDGFILDGHHRWATLAVAEAAGMEPRPLLDVLRVSMPIDALLAVADEFNRTHKVTAKTIHMASALTVFHLQGQHDQDDHGNRGGPAGRAERMDADERAAEAAYQADEIARQETYDTTLAVYNFTLDTPGDRQLEVEADPTVDYSGYASVSGTINDPERGQVGTFERTIDYETGTVSNDSLYIDAAYQGQGIGAAFLNRTEAELADAGIDRVNVSAVEVGRYAWAVRGYRLMGADADTVAKVWLEKAETIAETADLSDVQQGQLRAVAQDWRARRPVYGADLIVIDERFKQVFLDDDSPGWNGARLLNPSPRDRPWYDPNQLELDLTVHRTVFHLQGEHDQDTHGRRGGSRLDPRNRMSKPAGEAPIPDGAVRLTHRTWSKNLDSILADGLGGEYARQHDFVGEVVWAAAGVGYADGKVGGPWQAESDIVFVEFWMMPDELVVGNNQSPAFLEGNNAHVTMGAVPPDRFVGVHMPWHAAVRSFETRDLDAVRRGDYDNIGAEYPDTYGKAIEYIKANAPRVGPRNKGKSRKHWLDGLTVHREVFHLQGTPNDHNQKDHAGGGSGDDPTIRSDGVKFEHESVTSLFDQYNDATQTEDAKRFKHDGAANVAQYMDEDRKQEIADELNTMLVNDAAIPLGMWSVIANVEYFGADLERMPLGVAMQLSSLSKPWGESLKISAETSETFQSALDVYNAGGDPLELSATIDDMFGISIAHGAVDWRNAQWQSSAVTEPMVAFHLAAADLYDLPEAHRALMGYYPSGAYDTAQKIRRTMIPDTIRTILDADRFAIEDALQMSVRRDQRDTVTVYRGIKDTGHRSTNYEGATSTQGNPLTSWTTSPDIARDFAGEYGDSGGWIIKAEVPVGQIIGAATVSGWGSAREREVILLGNPIEIAELTPINRRDDE